MEKLKTFKWYRPEEHHIDEAVNLWIELENPIITRTIFQELSQDKEIFLLVFYQERVESPK